MKRQDKQEKQQHHFVYQATPDLGIKHTIGITSSGRAVSWGKNNFGQLGRTASDKKQKEEDAQAVECESSNCPLFVKAFVGGASDTGHSALLDQQGYLWFAGCDRWQQLGLGSTAGGSSGYTWNQGRIWRNQFVRNDFLHQAVVRQGENDIRDVALGGDHSVVLMSNRKDVYVFGKGGDGQLGVDGKPFVSAPTKPKVLSLSETSNQNIAAVCAIQHCSLTLDETGKILDKTGKCRNIEKSLDFCRHRAASDGLFK